MTGTVAVLVSDGETDYMSVTWRKTSYSTSNGGACIEVGVWRKASYSGSNGGGCVEVASGPAAVAVRDSKQPDGSRLAFGSTAWRTFTGRIKDGTLPLR